VSSDIDFFKDGALSNELSAIPSATDRRRNPWQSISSVGLLQAAAREVVVWQVCHETIDYMAAPSYS
jgi:hypothetical protein